MGKEQHVPPRQAAGSTAPPTAPALTYGTYLRLDSLLDLQKPQSEPQEHDELLFIVIHQVYELWFKEVLHEVDYLCAALQRADAPAALHTFKRVLTIFKTLVGQVDVLETMTPVSFASFRHRLRTASGFQSVQFRKLEIILGKREPGSISHNLGAAEELLALTARPSLYDAFLRYLAQRGYLVPAALLERDVREPAPESAAMRAILVEIYRKQGVDCTMCERMVDLDEGLQEWRYRHVKMVERTIGTMPGTGGSAGAAYLRSTLFRPMFPDLWAIRAEL